MSCERKYSHAFPRDRAPSAQVLHGKIEITTDLRERVKESVLSDEDVLFHWSMLTTDIEDDRAEILLVMLVDLFITIRGFSFTKSFMELYKQRTKKSTQKSKALRKTLTKT